jgi:hypothetical protein
METAALSTAAVAAGAAAAPEIIAIMALAQAGAQMDGSA